MLQNSLNRLRTSRHYQRRPIRVINFIISSLQRAGIARICLDGDYLVERAIHETGLFDFGTDEFRKPMELLIDSLEHEARLNPVGRFLAQQSLLRILKNRLMAEELFRNHPEINDMKIASPVIVMGLARAGTTRLHRLLACDPSFHHISSWESWNPVPWPESFTRRPDPRIAVIEKGLKFVLYMSPGIAAVHPLDVHAPEEELGLLQHSFSSQLWEVTAAVPSFTRWMEQHSQLFSYEYMLRLLRLVAWFRGIDGGTWVLKSPNHMQHFAEMAEVFPDARLVYTHRDPVRCTGSMCSVAWNGMVRDTDRLDAAGVGAEWFRKVDIMLRRSEEGRSFFPKGQVVDLLYKDLNEDPIGQIRKVYSFLGKQLSREAERAMRHWLADNGRHAQGPHRYRLQDFGLDKDSVESRFDWYRKKYSIPFEDRVEQVHEEDA